MPTSVLMLSSTYCRSSRQVLPGGRDPHGAGRRLRLDGPPGPRLPVPLLAALALSRARRGRRRPATGPPGAAARRIGLLGRVERRRAVDRLGLGIVDRADRLERLAGAGLVLARDGVLDLG